MTKEHIGMPEHLQPAYIEGKDETLKADQDSEPEPSWSPEEERSALRK